MAKEIYPKVKTLKSNEVCITFRYREDLLNFEEEARRRFSIAPQAFWKMSEAPRKSFWFSLKYTEKDEIVKLIELAFRISEN